MKLFLQEIMADIDWRLTELSSLKTIPIRYNFSVEHKDLHYKFSVPAIYSIWEGFVKNTLTIYSNYINSLQVKRNEISPELLTHVLDSDCNFGNPRINFNSKQKLVELLDSILVDEILIKPNIPTESNVNFKTLNKILIRFCVLEVDESYENRLNKLLRFRNMIAHGENSISVSKENIIEFISLIENLMLDIVINIQNSEINQTFKKICTNA